MTTLQLSFPHPRRPQALSRKPARALGAGASVLHPSLALLPGPLLPGLELQRPFASPAFRFTAPSHRPLPAHQSIFSQLRGCRGDRLGACEKQNGRGRNGRWGPGDSNRDCERVQQKQRRKENERDQRTQKTETGIRELWAGDCQRRHSEAQRRCDAALSSSSYSLGQPLSIP